MASVRFIPTTVHGVLDYAAGALMSSSPLFLKGVKNEKRKTKKEEAETDITSEIRTELKKAGPEQIIPYVMGAVSGIYSLFTNYELGVAKKIPMKVHLMLDAVGGAFLAASPWIFGFSKKVWIPFVAMGAFELSAALFTQTDSSTEAVPERFDV